MSASKLIKRLLKGRNRNDVETSNASATAIYSPPPSPAGVSTPQAPPLQIPSRLFSLPGEIRNKIYALAIYPTLSTISLHRAPEAVLSIPIFAICRQMRSEAISKLCSSKSFHFFGLATANAFFKMIGRGVGDLRSVTIHCGTDWRSEIATVAVEKADLIDYLELAASIRSLHVIVGSSLVAGRDEPDLMDAASEGARFLYKIRSVVDGEKGGDERAKVIQDEFISLCDQVGAAQAVRLLKENLTKEHEQRVEEVFRLGKVVSLEGNVEPAMLPLRLPEYLMRRGEE